MERLRFVPVEWLSMHLSVCRYIVWVVDERVVKEKIAGAMPLHLAYFFNSCAIGKVTTCLHGILVESEILPSKQFLEVTLQHTIFVVHTYRIPQIHSIDAPINPPIPIHNDCMVKVR
jgi:hypothetical protein